MIQKSPYLLEDRGFFIFETLKTIKHFANYNV